MGKDEFHDEAGGDVEDICVNDIKTLESEERRLNVGSEFGIWNEFRQKESVEMHWEELQGVKVLRL